MARLARRALRRLHVRSQGALEITFIDARRMRVLNKRFMRHDYTTDVLSFRYDARNGRPTPHRMSGRGGHVVGEILIAPAQARSYAKTHRIPYEQELSRYVVHGVLHWTGREDRTAKQRRTMRALEDRLLAKGRTWKIPPSKSQIPNKFQ